MTQVDQTASTRPEGLDQKYVVFKADEWSAYQRDQHLGLEAKTPLLLDPDSYFVIRDQDVSGAAALFGYAHLIQSMLELSRLEGREAVFSHEERSRLALLADRIVEFALTWQTRSTKKVPD